MRGLPARLILATTFALLTASWSRCDDGPTGGDPTGNSKGKDRPKAVIVVRPAAWAGAIKNWKEYRTSQGHEVLELDAELGRAGVQAAVTQLVKAAEKRHEETPQSSLIGYLLLIGDADQGTKQVPLLPAWYRRSTAMIKLGGDELLATDSPYADVDDDERPDLAVGRIPADTAEQTQQVLARSIAYERELDYGLWRRDVRIVAGVGGFGPLADSAIEMTTSRFLTDRVPAWCNVNMTYASPSSPFCPDPFQFSDATLQELDAGSQFWVYIGHGHVKHLDFVRVEDQQLSILDSAQIKSAPHHARPPIALFLACYTGAFDAREDCLSEKMLLSPGGPVAVLAASRVTGPYGLATMASGMLDQCYVTKSETLGDVFMCTKRKMLEPDEPAESTSGQTNTQMQLITAIAGALSPAGHDLMAERLEHVWQINLLGDPLLRLHHPQVMDIKATTRIQPGETISINGVSTQAGKATIELSLPRDRTHKNLFIAGKFTTDADVRAKMQDTYRQANQRTLATQSIELTQPGDFDCDVPTQNDLAPGRYLVRVFIEGKSGSSAGATEVQVNRPRDRKAGVQPVP